MELFAVLLVGVMVMCVIFFIRNEFVSKYRGDMINDIYEANVKEINKTALDLTGDSLAELDTMWRWNEYESVGYNEMVLKFWKPLSSFYPKNPAREIR